MERVEALRDSEKILSHSKSLSQSHGEEVMATEQGNYDFFFPLSCIGEHKIGGHVRERVVAASQPTAAPEPYCNAVCWVK